MTEKGLRGPSPEGIAKTYVKFVDDARGVEVQTLRGDVLGGIAWYGRWQEHVFIPEPGTIFSTGCLQDIAARVTQLNASRKQAVTA